ncbi:hypothetical protein EVAR_89468_1 [Eumeta japonica]|uniref:Integrase catalytic domain-containing protein n=1 Tax=Eumeta variegata TaxID=151549 RepID=A0A4C1ZJV8_EUMVA|nr:hypothetical protein EVAR_89468_1 [Eumeta japonica]
MCRTKKKHPKQKNRVNTVEENSNSSEDEAYISALKGQFSYEVIEQLKRWFAVHGIPEELQTNNGTQSMSREFNIFQKEWKLNHVTFSPHHHQDNGLAEKAVQVAKSILKMWY